MGNAMRGGEVTRGRACSSVARTRFHEAPSSPPRQCAMLKSDLSACTGLGVGVGVGVGLGVGFGFGFGFELGLGRL